MLLRNQSSGTDPALHPVLFPQHLEYLRQRGVSEALAKAARLSSVTKYQGAELLGWKSLACGGLAVPYVPQPGKNDHWRIRLDTPIKKPEGHEARWAAPGGEGARPYIPPFVPKERWADAAQKRVITEAPVKSLAVYGQLDYLSIGLAGAETGHDKEALSRGEFALHPELLTLPWEGYTAVLLLDANRLSKLGVMRGEKRLARCLQNAGAKVLVAELPPSDTGAEWGPDDFLAAKGPEALRKVIESARPAEEVHHPLQEIARRLKRSESGKPLSSLYNAALILNLDPRWEGVLGFDEFSLRVCLRLEAPWEEEWAPRGPKTGAWRDEDDTRLAMWLAGKWGVKLSSAQASEVVRVVAQKNSFHPVKEWLLGLKWDGVPRLSSWLVHYFGAADTRYTRAVGAKWLVSAVARAFSPGCEVKYMLILEGSQDLGKSAALCHLFSEEWFTDQISDFSRKDAGHDLWGKWGIEVAELDALLRSEPSSTKAFISRKVDHFRPSHGRRSLDFPRQCVLVGTVNEGTYLKDATGNVRFWPVRCSRADRDGVKAGREQLWAEAVARFLAGEPWWLVEGEVIADAREQQEARYVGDAWEEKIAEFLGGKTSVSVTEVLLGCFGLAPDEWEQKDQTRVARALSRLGWERVCSTVGTLDNGKRQRQWRYFPPDLDPVSPVDPVDNSSGAIGKPSDSAVGSSGTSGTT